MATKYGGYMGKILWIDLTTETTREYPFTDQERRETLGGKALAYHILHKELTGDELSLFRRKPDHSLHRPSDRDWCSRFCTIRYYNTVPKNRTSHVFQLRKPLRSVSEESRI